ncbi:DNA polymerase III subunit delta', partial [bacterium]|nr:DNA polymerase III subunit delta' [bacterium]
LDPLAAAASVDRVIKAEKRPAPLKAMVEWAQKWLYDLSLVSEGLPQRYFLSYSADLQRLAKSTHTANLLAFNSKSFF